MTLVADLTRHAIGVDTHRDFHVAAIITSPTGAVTAETRITADSAGYQQLLDHANSHTTTGERVWAIEGCGSYGAGLTTFLLDHQEWVVEVERPARPKRLSAAKTDERDAIRAGRETLGCDIVDTASPRNSSDRDALAVLLMGRSGAVDAATQAVNQFHAAVLVAPARLRERFSGLSTTRKLAAARRLRPDSYKDLVEADAATVLRSIAVRHQAETGEARLLAKRIVERVKAWKPELLEMAGVGPISAAAILVAWSHRGRCRNEGAFAMLAGAAPIPTGSGLSGNRVRLNPGGDRRLNAALYVIVMTRMRCDPETIAYAERRCSEGKTVRETRRCLKTYVARRMFKLLENGG